MCNDQPMKEAPTPASQARKLVLNPESRIQLEDLLEQETNTLRRKFEGHFDQYSAFTETLVRNETERIELLTMPLAQLVGVLSRWGCTTYFDDILEAILLVNQFDRPSILNSIPMILREYPAILLVSTTGVALTRERQWSYLYDLLSTRLRSGRSAPIRLVESLYSESWEGNDNQVWRCINGLERRKTPLADHICQIVEDWGRPFLGLNADFENLYDKWEILASLVYSEIYGLHELDSNLNTEMQMVPVGRNGWRGSHRDLVIEEIRMDNLRIPLLEAGFAQGDERFFNAAVDNLDKLARRIRWQT